MLKITLFCSSLCCAYLGVAADDAMIGPGKWKMLKMDKRPCDFEKFEFNMVQRKYNRTHDIFQGLLKFHEDLTKLFGVRIDVCKHVDGGCKQYQVISDNCFEEILNKYAKNNFKDMLGLAGVKEPDFPVRMGEYKFGEYLWDWNSMPEEGPFGHFIADCCVMEGTVEVGCLAVELSFEKTEDDDDDDDDEEE